MSRSTLASPAAAPARLDPAALETRLAERKEHITGVATGYDELDRMTAGLQPAEMIILAARPSMGKTALAMNIVQHAAMIDKVPVAVFSLEMSVESLALRMLCSLGPIDSQRVRTGRLLDSAMAPSPTPRGRGCSTTRATFAWASEGGAIP